MPAVGGSAHAHLMQRVGNDVLPGDKPGQHPFGCPAEQVADAPRQAAAHNDAALPCAGPQALLRLKQPADKRQAKGQDRRDEQVAERRHNAKNQQCQADIIAAAGLGQHPDAARVGNGKAGEKLYLMRCPERRDQQLTDREPHRGPQPAAAAQQHRHRGKQRRQHQILHHAHAGDVGNQQQRAQPDQVAVPVPRVGERHKRGRVGALCARGPVPFYVPLQVVGQRLKVIDVVGRIRHHGGQRRGFVGGRGLGQHDRVGVVVHLEQLEVQIFRVQPLTGDFHR